MYNAEEPYRSLAFRYIERLEIIPEEIDPDKQEQRSYFTPNKNTITYVYEKDRTNARGVYFTFFHELGHAIDYNYGIDEQMEGHYTDYNERNENTLAEHMHKDVENKIRAELNSELERPTYNDMNHDTKLVMINNITETFIYDGPSDDELTKDEERLYSIIQDNLSDELYSDVHHNASDVYGGVTVNEIIGIWGHSHRTGDYWIDLETEERINEPNKEGFASYYGSVMIKNDNHIESVDEYLPLSKAHMDEILKQMNEGESE